MRVVPMSKPVLALEDGKPLKVIDRGEHRRRVGTHAKAPRYLRASRFRSNDGYDVVPEPSRPDCASTQTTCQAHSTLMPVRAAPD
jgi:hypothetical protein